MNTSPNTFYPQNSLAFNCQGVSDLSSGEILDDSRPMAQQIKTDRIDSVLPLVASNYGKTRRGILDEPLQSHDVLREYGRNSLDSELTRRMGIVAYPKESHSKQISITYIFGFPYHASRLQRRIPANDTLPAGTQNVEQSWNSESQRSNRGHEAFLLLAQAKKLLSEQRIQDARTTLQLAACQFPKDKGIARLLRAISPGRTTRVKSTAMTNRNREIAWIRKHGINYRGQWVAIRNDELLASATTLRSVLEKLNQRELTDEEALIQYLVPN